MAIMKKLAATLAGLVLWALVVHGVLAQDRPADYPNKPIRYIVPRPPRYCPTATPSSAPIPAPT